MLKKIILIIFMVLLIGAVSSCQNERNIVEDASRTTLELPDKTRVISDLLILRSTIAQKSAISNEYPKTLKEFNLKLNMPISDYKYDKNTGIVKHKDYPKL